jgi:deoxyribonuclease-4
LIETDSGGSLIDDPSDLAQFWLDLDESIRSNVAICFDTCHVFAAGYDNLDMLLMFRDKGVPVRLIHFNDSKFAKGTKKDYHASFGHGLVGREELISVAKYATAMNIPMVTE